MNYSAKKWESINSRKRCRAVWRSLFVLNCVSFLKVRSGGQTKFKLQKQHVFIFHAVFHTTEFQFVQGKQIFVRFLSFSITLHFVLVIKLKISPFYKVKFSPQVYANQKFSEHERETWWVQSSRSHGYKYLAMTERKGKSPLIIKFNSN